MSAEQVISEKVELGRFEDLSSEKWSEKWDYKEKLQKEVSKENFDILLKAFGDYFRQHNVKYIKAEFSGGNDQGGIDSVSLYDGFDSEIENLPKVVVKDIKQFRFRTEYNDKTEIYLKEDYKTNITLPTDLEEFIISAGCLDEYGSFAGEFSVHGTITMDLMQRTWDIQGEQTYESYDEVNFSGEF